MNLGIDRKESSGRIFLNVSGEIDAYTVSRFKSMLARELEEGVSSLVVDLNEVVFIDSSGIAALVWAAKQLQEKRGEFHILCNNPKIISVFHIIGLDSLLPLITDMNLAPFALPAND